MELSGGMFAATVFSTAVNRSSRSPPALCHHHPLIDKKNSFEPPGLPQCARITAHFPVPCKEKQHKLAKVKTIKRWFRCGNCKLREWSVVVGVDSIQLSADWSTFAKPENPAHVHRFLGAFPWLSKRTVRRVLNQLLPGKACLRCGSMKWKKSAMMVSWMLLKMQSSTGVDGSHGLSADEPCRWGPVGLWI